MSAKKSLQAYQIDPSKSAAIFKRWARDAGMSYNRVASETGYSYDTINNIMAGRISDIGLERVLKIAVCTGHTVGEFLLEVMDGEDIDFADKIPMMAEYRAMTATAVDGESMPPQPDNALLDRFKAIYLRMIEQISGQYEREKASALEAFRETIAAKDDVILRQDRQIRGLNIKAGILTAALVLETGFIAVMLAFDVLNPSRGWIIRSMFNIGGAADAMKG